MVGVCLNLPLVCVSVCVCMGERENEGEVFGQQEQTRVWK